MKEKSKKYNVFHSGIRIRRANYGKEMCDVEELPSGEEIIYADTHGEALFKFICFLLSLCDEHIFPSYINISSVTKVDILFKHNSSYVRISCKGIIIEEE